MIRAVQVRLVSVRREPDHRRDVIAGKALLLDIVVKMLPPESVGGVMNSHHHGHDKAPSSPCRGDKELCCKGCPRQVSDLGLPYKVINEPKQKNKGL